MENNMTLINRIAKKLRRRTRVKGTYIRPTSGLTVAELLIQSWYGKPTGTQPSGPSPANLRAIKRHSLHRDQWEDTPKTTKVSRQVRRRFEMMGA